MPGNKSFLEREGSFLLTVLKLSLGAVSKEYSCHSISSYCLGTVNVGKVKFSMMGGVFSFFGQKNSGEQATLLSLKILSIFVEKKIEIVFYSMSILHFSVGYLKQLYSTNNK